MAAPAGKAALAASTPLSAAGKIFFGSLCAGTFTLGCWQCSRLVEKQGLVQQRTEDLAKDPVPYAEYSKETEGSKSFRRILLQGQLDHSGEFLIGPRGPPPGALPDKPGSSAQGMASSPQGYFVMTPLKLSSADNKMILVNRGWVPRHMVVEDSRGGRRPQQRQQQQQQPQEEESNPQLLQWDRPAGDVAVTVVPATAEEPKFLVADHNFKDRPPKLYWFDLPAMLACAGMPFVSKDAEQPDEQVPVLVTQVRNNNDKDEYSWPVSPTADKVGDFKVSPAVHAGYAFTWFGLSGAGLYMTRILISRGRKV